MDFVVVVLFAFEGGLVNADGGELVDTVVPDVDGIEEFPAEGEGL